MSESLRLAVTSERWPLRAAFKISRQVFHHSQIVSVTISDGTHTGRGECEPHESDPAAIRVVMNAICDLEQALADGLSREALARLLPAGPARNAIDCALWDLEAKRSGTRAWEMIDLPMTREETAYTLGMDTPQTMAALGLQCTQWNLLKIKLGGSMADDLARVRAIRTARPDARLIVDANGGWSLQRLREMSPALHDLGVELIEQPLPVGDDDGLSGFRSSVPLCADESCLDRSSLEHVVGRYRFINIKLDKTGGLTEALALCCAAQKQGLGIMVGCMVGTSLAMAPAMLAAQHAEFIDLDGPMLLAADREPGIVYRDGRMSLPARALWG